MQSLTYFLGLLPGVMPRKASEAIYQNEVLSSGARRDIHSRDLNLLDTVMLVGPDAAAELLAAYKERRLPMKRGAKVQEAPEAEAYVLQAETWRDQIAERRRRDDCLKDITLVRESDFNDNRLMDRIFFAHAGKGSGTLTLAGIQVTKSLRGFSSNSGKTTGWQATFSWIGNDGVRHDSGSALPPEAFNRRNDEERNWGLHE